MRGGYRSPRGVFGRNKSKYGAKPADGFGSKLERAVHDSVLLPRQLAGEIGPIRRQHSVVLQEGDKSVRICWKIDFSYPVIATGEIEFAEAKGFETADFKLKLKMFKKHPHGRLKIYKGSYKKPFLAEVVEGA